MVIAHLIHSQSEILSAEFSHQKWRFFDLFHSICFGNGIVSIILKAAVSWIEHDYEMNMIENMQFSFGFLAVWILAYLMVRWFRPHAGRSQEVTIDLVSSSATNLLFWGILFGIVRYLQNSNESLLNILNLVLDTRIILVPWAFLSYGLVSLGFQMNRVSQGHVDWRTAMTSIVILLTVVFSVYYYLTGIPVSPLGLPW